MHNHYSRFKYCSLFAGLIVPLGARPLCYLGKAPGTAESRLIIPLRAQPLNLLESSGTAESRSIIPLGARPLTLSRESSGTAEARSCREPCDARVIRRLLGVPGELDRSASCSRSRGAARVRARSENCFILRHCKADKAFKRTTLSPYPITVAQASHFTQCIHGLFSR
jgi:hypothetical protein